MESGFRSKESHSRSLFLSDDEDHSFGRLAEGSNKLLSRKSKQDCRRRDVEAGGRAMTIASKVVFRPNFYFSGFHSLSVYVLYLPWFNVCHSNPRSVDDRQCPQRLPILGRFSSEGGNSDVPPLSPLRQMFRISLGASERSNDPRTLACTSEERVRQESASDTAVYKV